MNKLKKRRLKVNSDLIDHLPSDLHKLVAKKMVEDGIIEIVDNDSTTL